MYGLHRFIFRKEETKEKEAGKGEKKRRAWEKICCRRKSKLYRNKK
jgi:hypothetical protein